MLTSLKELMGETFIGISLGIILMVLFSLYILFLVYRIKPKKRGYIVGHYAFGEIMMKGSMIFVTFLLILFILLYCLGVEDVNGNKPTGHIILFSSIGYLCAFLYLYYGYKRIYFNDKEIIVKTLLKREKTYYWKDIIYTIFKFNNMIIVYTNKGKFIFDNEFTNFKKFLNKLEEKNILIYNNKKEEN